MVILNQTTDIVYSPDDGGYYLQEFHPTEALNRVSKLYDTRREAMDAFHNNSVEWKEWN